MLKYTTILESKKFKLSRVKNTTTKKSWYSILYYGYDIFEDKIHYSIMFPEMEKHFGANDKILYTGREWKFKDLKTATKKYRWALLRWA